MNTLFSDPDAEWTATMNKLAEMANTAELLKAELRIAIGRWIEAGRTVPTFDAMVEAFDRWKLAKWNYDRAIERTLDLPFEK